MLTIALLHASMDLQGDHESIVAAMARVAALPSNVVLRTRKALAAITLRLNARASSGLEQLLHELQWQRQGLYRNAYGEVCEINSQALSLYSELDKAAADVAHGKRSTIPLLNAVELI